MILKRKKARIGLDIRWKRPTCSCCHYVTICWYTCCFLWYICPILQFLQTKKRKQLMMYSSSWQTCSWHPCCWYTCSYCSSITIFINGKAKKDLCNQPDTPVADALAFAIEKVKAANDVFDNKALVAGISAADTTASVL